MAKQMLGRLKTGAPVARVRFPMRARQESVRSASTQSQDCSGAERCGKHVCPQCLELEESAVLNLRF